MIISNCSFKRFIQLRLYRRCSFEKVLNRKTPTLIFLIVPPEDRHEKNQSCHIKYILEGICEGCARVRIKILQQFSKQVDEISKLKENEELRE